MGRIIAVTNPKSGVGKSTTVVHLAQAIAMSGVGTLVVDMDPAGGATRALGATRSRSGLLLDIIKGHEPPEKIGLLVRSVEAGLDLVPGDVTVEDESAGAWSGATLRKALEEVQSEYPWIFLDCPPSRGSSTHCACHAADAVLTCVQGDLMALDGVLQVESDMPTLEDEDRKGPDHIVMTMCRERNPTMDEVQRHLRERYPGRLRSTSIPWDSTLVEAARSGRTVLQENIEGRGARAYAQLAKEIMSHVG